MQDLFNRVNRIELQRTGNKQEIERNERQSIFF